MKNRKPKVKRAKSKIVRKGKKTVKTTKKGKGKVKVKKKKKSEKLPIKRKKKKIVKRKKNPEAAKRLSMTGKKIKKDIGRNWGLDQNIQDIYSMNYKLKSEQTLGNAEAPEAEFKNFKFSEQYYNIQHNRVMQLPSMEIRTNAVDGDRQMSHSPEPSQEHVMRRMDFQFQKKIEADKEGLRSLKESESQEHVQRDRGGSFGLKMEQESQNKSEEKTEEEFSSGREAPKLMYFHEEKHHQNPFELETKALGKFFVDRKNEIVQSKSVNVSSKRTNNCRKKEHRE